MKLIGSALSLVLVSQLAGCGSRSGVDCQGESCVPREEDGSEGERGEAPPSDDDPVGSLPPGLAPLPPPRTPPNGAGSVCDLDRIFDGSLEVDGEDDLELLVGCEQVDGDLTIRMPSLDGLEELRALRVVQGTLTLAFSGTLTGLESLEVVGNLSLDQLGVPTLAPLGNLRQIGTGFRDDLLQDGQLRIHRLAQARDLAGLGGLETMTGIEITDAGSLESLQGLRISPWLRRVVAQNSPGLRDLSGLSGVGALDELLLAEVGIDTLRGLELLHVVDLMSLANLPNLVDMSQLRNLTSVRHFSILGLPLADTTGLEGLRYAEHLSIQYSSFRNVGELASLEELSSLLVVGNPNLVRMPEMRLRELEQVEIRDNASLTIGPSFPEIVELDALMITGNPSLAALTGFPDLQRADAVDITSNSALRELDLDDLRDVDQLNISCNAVLPEASVEPLRRFGTTASIYGNEGSTAPCTNPP